MSRTDYGGYRRRFKPGRASDYICLAAKYLKPGTRVVLCLRVSRYAQKRHGNLADQEANLRKAVARRGAIVVAVVRHVGSGYDPDWLAVAAGRAAVHGAVLLAETTDRFIRTRLYDRDCQDVQARPGDLEYLRYCTDGMLLLTDLRPDATPEEVRTYQIRRGRLEKDKQGGRPMRPKNRRAKLKPEALKLRRDGVPLSEIEKRLKLPLSTVQRWVSHFDGETPAADGETAW